MAPRLLALFAHPDDETYGPAALIRHAAAYPGGRARIVIATRGEAGTLGISRSYTPESLARVRQCELLDAAGVLGAEVFMLGWPDRGVERVPAAEAVETLVREIRLFRPQVVLTFHPNGISGHPDHIAMTRYVTDAVAAAADPARFNTSGPPWQCRALLYYGLPESKGRAVAHFRHVHVFPDAECRWVFDARPYLPVKHAASRAHVSQISFYRQLQEARPGLDTFWAREHFVEADLPGGSGSDGPPFPGLQPGSLPEHEPADPGTTT